MSGAFQDLADEQVDRELSENVAEDIVEVARGNIVGNEQQVLLGTLQFGTAWMYDMDRYVNSLHYGPSGCGKTEAQKVEKKCIPREAMYGDGNITKFSDNAPLDDPDWDRSLLFVGDEYDKINKTIQNFFKSMAGEDEGMAKKRNVENKSAKGGYSPEVVSSSAMPFQFLYAPEGRKSSIPVELDTRMMKLPVDDEKQIRTGVHRKEFGHEEINTENLDHEYIYGTTDLERALRQHMRSLTVIEEYDDGSEIPVEMAQMPSRQSDEPVARRGGTFVEMPRWVAYCTEPIFDMGDTGSNRYFGVVANLIRSSAVWNHHERPTVTTEYEGETKEAILVAPQDVANVLSCQRALLSTTHGLTPLKRHLLDAVRSIARTNNQSWATASRIQEYLDDNDIPHPSETTLKNRLDDLTDEYFLRKYESVAGKNGQAHAWEHRQEGAIQPPRLFNLTEFAQREGVELGQYAHITDVRPDDPFADARDPIRDQPFETTVEGFKADFSSDAGGDGDDSLSMTDAMGGTDTDATDADGADTGGQSSLGDVEGGSVEMSPDDPLDPSGTPDGPTADAVYERLRDMDGERLAGTAELPHYLGVVEPGAVVEDSALTETMFDPAHEMWQDRPDLTDDRVTSISDAKREIDDAFAALTQKGLVALSEAHAPVGMVEIKAASLQRLAEEGVA